MEVKRSFSSPPVTTVNWDYILHNEGIYHPVKDPYPEHTTLLVSIENPKEDKNTVIYTSGDIIEIADSSWEKYNYTVWDKGLTLNF